VQRRCHGIRRLRNDVYNLCVREMCTWSVVEERRRVEKEGREGRMGRNREMDGEGKNDWREG